jgi:DNA-binding NtrC family response regulator
MINPFGHSQGQISFRAAVGDDRFMPSFGIFSGTKELVSSGSSEARTARASLPKELRVLIVGDSSHDELSFINELHLGGFEVLARRVESIAGVESALAGNAWDLIICDYCLRATTGPAVLTLYHQMGLDIPFIMVSDLGEDLAAEVLKAGAHSYVTKQNLTPLVPALIRELRAGRERQVHSHLYP